jgi:hypothetical protein
MREPDFYLASSEGYDMDKPRRCWRVKRIATRDRDDLLVVKIDPPLLGQKYGTGSRDLDVVVLAARHQGASLFPVTEWPTAVHVARPLVDPALLNVLAPEHLDLIAWAEIYPSDERARRKQ